MLHHFAFGDSKGVDYNFKINPESSTSSNCNNSPSTGSSNNCNANTLKKFKNIDEAGSVSCHFLDINSGFRDLLIDTKHANEQQCQEGEIYEQTGFDTSGIIVEELCNCEHEESTQRRGSSSSLLHLSLSYGKGKTCAHTEYKLKQELLNDVNNYFEEEDEDEQIKRKENLLQELLKIEKQLDSQKNQGQKQTSPMKANKQDEINASNNYDHISMINKYLIKKCQYDLNRLYKIKLKQLQQKPIELEKSSNEKQQIQAHISKALPAANVISPQVNVSSFHLAFYYHK